MINYNKKSNAKGIVRFPGKTDIAFYVSSIILVMTVVLSLYSLYQVKRFQHEGEIINTAGKIRGSIQRIARTAALGGDVSTYYDTVDNYFEGFRNRDRNLRLNEMREDFYHTLDELEERWKEFKSLVEVYREAPTAYNQNDLLIISEICWKLSNNLVMISQSAYEKKLVVFDYIILVLVMISTGMMAVIWIIRNYVSKRLEYAAHHDTLTGALNRNSFDLYLDKELTRVKRNDLPITLLIMDLDKFKEINDTYGHKLGDTVLIDMVSIILWIIRASDLFFRIGGEEFAIIVSDISMDEVKLMADKVRTAVETHRFAKDMKVTISIGAARATRNDTSDSLFRRADAYLYQAKREGRNRVILEDNHE